VPFIPKRQLPLFLLLLIAAGLVGYLVFHQPPAPPPVTVSKPPPVAVTPPGLSALAEMPDWETLDVYQESITRDDFERLLTSVFTTGTAWRAYIDIDDAGADIQTGDGIYQLRFAANGATAAAARDWRVARELPPAPDDKPLLGLRIAIDPGHIGGEWARMEARWFVIGDGKPVCEGDMTLRVAELLKPRLEALGAEVSMVREKPEPVTPLRPESLLGVAGEAGADPDSPAELQRFAERLFYRTAEIRARARLVNTALKPDIVLCLHFNAEAWGDPANPTLVDRSHLHLLLNGAYNDEEVALADQRFALLRKLLQRTHEEEADVGATVADTFAEISGLPPYSYPPDSPNARQVNGHPYLWARNLLANRLYDCPVIFMEPYIMNSRQDYLRIQAGDYEGLRDVGGVPRPSIFREYADALTLGLDRHYRKSRGR
jgi:N-acetylmuramoyl-L-alanine amidase